MNNILVIGGAGFIGSHVAFELKINGYNVVVLDNLCRGHRYIVEDVLKLPLIVGSFGDPGLLETVLCGQHPACSYPIDAVVHLAAYAYVGESFENPLQYYENNVAKTISLLDVLLRIGLSREHLSSSARHIPLVFSSTCATFGNPSDPTLCLDEDHEQKPINPYGRSKLMIEWILKDVYDSHGFPSTALRYFNAAGSHKSIAIGELHVPETHLIPLALEAAYGSRPYLQVFGNDYSTPDGTCLRDYIHVMDLAHAHLLSLKHQQLAAGHFQFNLGSGAATSVLQVVDAVERVTGRNVPLKFQARRLGDPPFLSASSNKAMKVLGWIPSRSGIDEIVSDASRWYSQNVLSR
tara:strand:+ start:400 stop:1449 length:1050 start_codon:yes stop_codon:yes gene_type:complete